MNSPGLLNEVEGHDLDASAPPGTPCVALEFVRRLGIGRTPTREALRRLREKFHHQLANQVHLLRRHMRKVREAVYRNRHQL